VTHANVGVPMSSPVASTFVEYWGTRNKKYVTYTHRALSTEITSFVYIPCIFIHTRQNKDQITARQ